MNRYFRSANEHFERHTGKWLAAFEWLRLA